jgi:hypothetical protein
LAQVSFNRFGRVLFLAKGVLDMASSPQSAPIPERKIEEAPAVAPAPQLEPKKRKFFITIVSHIPG